MNIYENLKNDRKIIREKNRKQRLKFGPCDSRPTLHPYDDYYWLPTTRNLEPVIVDLPYTPKKFLLDAILFIWTTKMQKYCPQNLTHLGYVKLNGFSDNL